VTNGGGPGIIAADASARNGLHLPDLSQDTVTKLKSVIRRDIKINNPVDLTASGSAEEFHDVLKLLARDDDVDAVLTIFVPPILTEAGPMTAAIGGAAPLYWRERKPLLACFLGQRGFKTKLGSQGKLVPCYPFPEEAVLALSRAAEYAEMRERPRGRIPRLRGIRRERARKTMERAMAKSSQRPLWLSPPEMCDLLECYGIHVAEMLSATTANEAAIQASKIGFPVAVKLLSSTISHKTDVGGVILDLNSEREVRQAFNNIRANLAKIGREKEMEGVTLQRMVKGGIETIVGVTQDPSFGPLMMFGMGGIYAELVKDVSLRLHPLTDLDASETVRSIKMAKLLEGYRGSPPSDLEAVEDLLLRLSAMVEDLPQIDELDFNPVKVMPKGEGYRLLDARIMVR
jgi:acetate---CoA ligase (ADP-forming)